MPRDVHRELLALPYPGAPGEVKIVWRDEDDLQTRYTAPTATPSHFNYLANQLLAVRHSGPQVWFSISAHLQRTTVCIASWQFHLHDGSFICISQDVRFQGCLDSHDVLPALSAGCSGLQISTRFYVSILPVHGGWGIAVRERTHADEGPIDRCKA